MVTPPPTLKKRAAFLRVRGGYRAASGCSVIEARERFEHPTVPVPASIVQQRAIPSPAVARFGFTVTKKLGNAVVRNRIRRRLKAGIAELAGTHAIPNLDYVVVARRAAFNQPFPLLQRDLTSCLDRIARSAKKAQKQPAIKATLDKT